MKKKLLFAAIIYLVILAMLSCGEKETVQLTEGPGDTALLEFSSDLEETFKCLENGYEVELEYDKYALQWNGRCFDFIGYHNLFDDRFAAGDTLPQMISDGAEIAVSFGAYTPAAITVMRDTATYDRDKTEEIPAEEVPTIITVANSASEQTAVFSLDFGDSEVLYYTVTAKWSNGNMIMYAFAVKRP
ncbi:MAG: hypothetical protein ACYCWE_01305 [Eubacteriales bacterium]